MAHRFTVMFEKEDEGGYHIFCSALPGCHTQSETIDEGIANIREAIELYLESLVDDGLQIPSDNIAIIKSRPHLPTFPVHCPKGNYVSSRT